MPFISEVIWHDINQKIQVKDANPLIASSYPKENKKFLFSKPKKDFEAIQNIVVNIRNIRSENKVEAGKWHETTIISESSVDLIESMSSIIAKMGRCLPLNIISKQEGLDIDDFITASLPIGLILIPLNELIDVDNEIKKINSEIENTQSAIKKINDLLTNKDFIQKAPKNVVASNQKKMEDLQDRLKNLHSALERITNKK